MLNRLRTREGLRRLKQMRDITPTEIAAMRDMGRSAERIESVFKAGILSVRERYPNLLDFTGELAAVISAMEPTFKDDKEVCVRFIMHSQTLIAQSIAMLEITDKPVPLGLDKIEEVPDA